MPVPGPSRQAPTEILAEQHFRTLQRLVQDMTREAGRRGETGFRQPRIERVGGVVGRARSCLDGWAGQQAKTPAWGQLAGGHSWRGGIRLKSCGRGHATVYPALSVISLC